MRGGAVGETTLPVAVRMEIRAYIHAPQRAISAMAITYYCSMSRPLGLVAPFRRRAHIVPRGGTLVFGHGAAPGCGGVIFGND